jgi:hypothetical protein
MPLEIAGKVPELVGVQTFLEVLNNSVHAEQLSVGQVCGGRVSVVWFGGSLEVLSCTLEPFELSDAALCHSRALEFISELEQLEQKNL